MASGNRVTLIFDPYGIYDGQGLRIRGVQAERRAFTDINRSLASVAGDETVAPMTLVLDQSSASHFATYRRVTGVQIVDLTPRNRITEMIGREPPLWLSNELIRDWGLMGRPVPQLGSEALWDEVVADWLVPGISAADTLEHWLRALCNAPGVDGIPAVHELHNWFINKFGRLLEATRDPDTTLIDEFREAGSPTTFARQWATRRALLPLADPNGANPLRDATVDVGGVRARFLAQRFPLLFPLPGACQQDVSAKFINALRRARNMSPGSLEPAILALNAVWDGVGEEILSWVELHPSYLTRRALAHLSSLPGWPPALNQALADYAPPDAVPPWRDEADALGEWAAGYARWARSAFLRRELPPNNLDPSAGFSAWLKANALAAFSDPRRSYLTASKRIRDALAKGRSVIVLVVDAMAIHVADIFRRTLSCRLSAEPTQCDYLLAPVPTITEVCKAAIITGKYPSQAARDLGETVCDTYCLSQDQVILGATWEDPVRLRVTPKTRLIVYRDNRLDDRIHSTGSYRDLLRDCDTLADRLAGDLARLVSDVQCLSGAKPLVLLTADHGFTYGPPPGAETVSHRPLDPNRRCVALSDRPSPAEAADTGLTFIDADVFHTGRHFLAARGRSFGGGTSTGWKLSHGGLLPEEVIIPLFEWYGAEVIAHWPALEPLGQAVIEQGMWLVSLRLCNRGTLRIPAGDVQIAAAGTAEPAKAEFSTLAPGQVWDVRLQVPAGPDRAASDLVLGTVTTVTLPSGERRSLQRDITVQKARQLMERTGDQSAFEGMFG